MAERRSLNYDPISATYDRRYGAGASRLEGIGRALAELVQAGPAEVILEVGCGTGHWLESLRALPGARIGLDLSLGMLRQAQEVNPERLICAEAGSLPVRPAGADLIFVVNAAHHFPRQRDFITDAYRVLRPGGALAIIGIDPSARQNTWYLYDFFTGVEQADRQRYPSSGQLLDWMAQAGFDRVEWRLVERVRQTLWGEQVLQDPFLQKNGTSQLALLSEEEYRAGLAQIHAALDGAKKEGTSSPSGSILLST